MYKLEEYISYSERFYEGNELSLDDIFANADLTSKQKNLFNNVKKIIWLYNFKNYNTNIPIYEDDKKIYDEVEVFEVLITKKDDTEAISKILQQAITYPSLIIFHYNEQLQLSVAHERKNLADSKKITLTDHRMTDWINLFDLDDFDKKLFEDLKLENLNKTNFLEFYSDILDTVTLYNSSKEVGHILTISADKAREINNQIYEIDKQLRKKNAELKKEVEFNVKTEINMEIYELKQQKENLKEQLI